MKSLIIAGVLSFATLVAGQQPGTYTAEVHPKLVVSTCTKTKGCTSTTNSVTLDAGFRWVHGANSSNNCYTGTGDTGWDSTFCPDPVTCAQNCALEGADYKNNYGISSSGNSLRLNLVTKTDSGTNIGSRVYLMDSSDKNYQLLKLLNQEFAFDVNVSSLPCGVNGALYLSEMPGDGGSSKFPSNKAGASYGTGYCDAQCPSYIQFIEGEANFNKRYGACCNEMDLWEANSASTAYTPHSCSKPLLYRCETNGTECSSTGVCDHSGCDLNTYRLGNTNFYGPGKTVDTNKIFTVVTQYITSNNTASGNLVEIRRYWAQNGKVIGTPHSTYLPAYNSITDSFCKNKTTLFGETDHYLERGGNTVMGEAIGRGMVLVMSIWDDSGSHMLWLDSTYPTTANASTPGVARGPCSTSSGVPSEVEAQYPDSNVVFSNIKWGDIGSTTPGVPGAPALPNRKPT